MKDFTAVDIYGKKYNRSLLVVVLLNVVKPIDGTKAYLTNKRK